MDAFVVDDADLEPDDPGVGLKLGCSIANDILDEHRVVVGLHGDEPLVGALEQWVDCADGDRTFFDLPGSQIPGRADCADGARTISG